MARTPGAQLLAIAVHGFVVQVVNARDAAALATIARRGRFGWHGFGIVGARRGRRGGRVGRRGHWAIIAPPPTVTPDASGPGSAQRRVGTEWGSTGRSRGVPFT